MMSNFLRISTPYIPPTLLRAVVKKPIATTTPLAERFLATVLFADVSGFTPLTEKLAQKGSEGPEELSRLLNNYFSQMISLIEAQGGEVVKFSGDALTVLFPATGEPLSHTIRRAMQAASAMQAAMGEFEALQTSVGLVSLGMKIGLGAGEVLAMQIGGIFGRWEYLIAGDPLHQVAAAEKQAQRGDIILSPAVQSLIHPNPLPPQPLILPDLTHLLDPISVEDNLLRFIPGAILRWLKDSLRQWLAVLRPMTVLFIGIGGLDYADPDAVNQLHHFLRTTQDTLYRYQGSINKLAVDDKGTILLALLGAPPFAHEDDGLRAIRCALDLQALVRNGPLRLAIGVASGQVFAGPVGSETRREYTVMGDTVNIAARLMSHAGGGYIQCDFNTYRQACRSVCFEHLLPVRLKGKAGLIRLYRPLEERKKNIGATEQSRHRGSDGGLIGRQKELAQMEAALKAVEAGQSRVLIIQGEAGIGKSRLVKELFFKIQARGLSGLLGAGNSIEQQTPYRAWSDVFTSFFDLDDMPELSARRKRVERVIQELAPNQIERLPLLNDVLNLGWPDNDLTASLPPDLRQKNLLLLLLALLQAWAKENPLIIVLEDGHWLDSLSWDFALKIAQMLKEHRLLLLLVTRPLGHHAVGREQLMALEAMSISISLWLKNLSEEETIKLVTANFGLPLNGLPEPVAQLVRSRAGGNPFFAEELIHTLRDRNLITIEANPQTNGLTADNHCIINQDLSQAVQTLPHTIQGIVLSRIDRLPPQKQLTLKVAAVIGRTFTYKILYYVLQQHTTISDSLLRSQLNDFASLELTPQDVGEQELSYGFKHIITQEVAYQSLLFAQRRQLHRTVAQWYEKTITDSGGHNGQSGTDKKQLEELAPLLGYHFAEAGDNSTALKYFILAGDVATRLYATTEAIAHYTRALAIAQLTPVTSQQLQHLYLKRGGALELSQQHQQALSNYQTMQQIAMQFDDRSLELSALIAQATIQATPTSVYDVMRSQTLSQKALQLARQLGDQAAESKALWTLMLCQIYSGHSSLAIPNGQQSVILARQLNLPEQLALALNDLHRAYFMIGNLDYSIAALDEARQLLRQLDNKPMLADNLGNSALLHYSLGQLDQALAYAQEGTALSLSISNAWGQSYNQLMSGRVYFERGEIKKALRLIKKAAENADQSGFIMGQVFTRIELAWIYSTLGAIERGLQIAREYESKINQIPTTFRAWSLAILARLEFMAGKTEQGSKTLQKSYLHFNRDQMNSIAFLWISLAEAELAWLRAEYQTLTILMSQTIYAFHQIQALTFLPDMMLFKARALLAQNQRREARQQLQEAVTISHQLNQPRNLWQIRSLQSKLEAQLGNHSQAHLLQQEAQQIIQQLANQIEEIPLRITFIEFTRKFQNNGTFRVRRVGH